jgi:hypothetical protein
MNWNSDAMTGIKVLLVQNLNLKEVSVLFFPKEFGAWINSMSEKHYWDLHIYSTKHF